MTKKTIKSFPAIVVSALLVAISVSCTKEFVDPSLVNNRPQYNLGEKRYFSCAASATLPAGNKAYANLADSNVYWENNDILRINNADIPINRISSDGLTAYFSGSISPIEDNVNNTYAFFSVYPHTLINSASDWGGSGTSSLVPTIKLPARQLYTDVSGSGSRLPHNYMAAYTVVPRSQETIHLYFKNLCCLFKLRLISTSGTKKVSKVCVYTSDSEQAGFHGADGLLQFAGSNNAAVPTIQWDNCDATSHKAYNYQRKLTLDCTHETGGYVEVGSSYKEFVIMIPINLITGISNGELCVEVYNEDSTRMMRMINSAPNLKRNHIYTSDVTLDMDREGFIDGDFSISATKVAKFSRGNLQWLPSSNGNDSTTLTHAVKGGGTRPGKWRFAIHQYDMVGGADNHGTVANLYSELEWDSTGTTLVGRTKVIGNGGTNYEYSINDRTNEGRIKYGIDWHDLFGFGTSGYVCRPWENKTSGSYTGSSTDIANTNYDWGVYNAISNGGNKPDMWRCLTMIEWRYILRDRPHALSKIGLSQITDAVREWNRNTMTVHGCVILPDQFALPTGCTWSAFNTTNSWNEADGYISTTTAKFKWSDNSYTVAQWREMEKAGAIFIPISGYREGKVLNSFNERGYAYSSSRAGSASANHYFYCGTNNSKISYMKNSGTNDYYGRGVRLIMDW